MGVRTTEQGPEGDKNHRAGPHYFHMRWPLGLLKAKGMLSHFQAFLSLKHRGISHVMSHHLGAESGRRFPKLPSSLERLRAPSSLHPHHWLRAVRTACPRQQWLARLTLTLWEAAGRPLQG